jgi:hypothetical protein
VGARTGKELAFADAERVAGAGDLTGDNLYNLALFYSQASAGAEAARAPAQQYRKQAIDCLRRAARKGNRNLALLKEATELDPIRSEEEFKTFMHELEQGIRN